MLIEAQHLQTISSESQRMKLNGKPVSPVPLSMTFVLQRHGTDSLTLQLRPLPLGFHRRLRERGIVAPAPPTRIARDPGGRPIRDPQGLAVSVAEPHDAKYLCELECYHQRVAVLSIVESLAADPNVQFDTTPPDNSTDSQSWSNYADQLAAELESAAFSAGDLIRICDAVCRLSNLVDEHLEGTHENFSSALSHDST
ncbi:MAG: hypothetical protein R3C18_20605 [Planctomycetaceae bacterium]